MCQYLGVLDHFQRGRLVEGTVLRAVLVHKGRESRLSAHKGSVKGSVKGSGLGGGTGGMSHWRAMRPVSIGRVAGQVAPKLGAEGWG